ncbi:MAG: 2-hydroxyacyl-CoA dehydratase [Candidatus Eisenbacteria bacterium]|nr:2-hydroxyacyl-CoA dehydratase [Candidatus Eisenbacteria bacterium]
MNETIDYRPMWKALGLNLEAHDGLLAALGQAYRDIYLSQEDRPDGMGYFDFVISEIHGLRIQELVDARQEGRKVIGTFCLYVPEELVLAVDGICIGLCAGADIGTEEAEKVLPRNTCALIKSFFGFTLSGLCPYVSAADLVVGETTCDGKKKAYEIFDDYKPTFVIEVPHMKTAAGRALWRSELERLARKLEEVSGRQITAESLREGVRIVNAKRAALHRLNELRSANPAPISGRDALLINQIAFYDDPQRFTQQVNALCDELEQRVQQGQGVAGEQAPRLLVSGCPMAAPNWKLPFVIEKSGAVIVGEESCVGERGTRNLVTETDGDRESWLDRIADRYLDIDCACFTPNPERLDHIAAMAQRYRADGVVHYALQFCAPYTIEARHVERRLSERKIPLLRIETDYSMEDLPQLETRVQAFLEMLPRRAAAV